MGIAKALDPEPYWDLFWRKRYAYSYTQRIGWIFAPRKQYEQDRSKYE